MEVFRLDCFAKRINQFHKCLPMPCIRTAILEQIISK